MVQLLQLSDYVSNKKGKPIYFGRQDLIKMMGIYAGQVARGVWRDYALDHTPERAIFSVFKRAQEAPLFEVTKYKSKHGMRYALTSRHRQIKSSKSLEEVLEALKEVLFQPS